MEIKEEDRSSKQLQAPLSSKMPANAPRARSISSLKPTKHSPKLSNHQGMIYGSVTMSNILCLSVFLGLVYIRELKWCFSSEVLIILIVCILMGAFASFRTTFPMWTCLVAYALYPFSILLVYVFEYVVKLS
ncbi:hypothetical protein TEA_003439 [Camellia sinensis var. sinensis]|uniref:Uncharacterized protein n=1 Tax=Camellia sinensis var. sinensis TaxID=542762 RepID=A0A4S4EHH9_CAMSN|nr:hypothetical protein TEA_003439 [Camellia sinensis var. sinensis]